MRLLKDNCLLKRVEKQEQDAINFGLCWESINQIIEQIQSECNEIKDAYEKGDITHLQEEIGDLIQAAIGIAVFCKTDPHETMLRSIDKFQKRYDAIVKMVHADGRKNLENQPLDVLMYYWNRAKLES